MEVESKKDANLEPKSCREVIFRAGSPESVRSHAEEKCTSKGAHVGERERERVCRWLLRMWQSLRGEVGGKLPNQDDRVGAVVAYTYIIMYIVKQKLRQLRPYDRQLSSSHIRNEIFLRKLAPPRSRQPSAATRADRLRRKGFRTFKGTFCGFHSNLRWPNGQEKGFKRWTFC